MRHSIDGAMFRRMIISAAASIEIHKEKINELNVFPVPDGDTGTNMSMTLNAAAADLRRAEDPNLGKAASITASALLR
ncbi:MAG: DAK2 domain-containing protein, partial [Oscillospiraceae bacterium]|nr:DAK2 domain-containing protein [Oscillospiraceae bacterium]